MLMGGAVACCGSCCPRCAGGVKAGDIITSVDGKPTAGLSLYESSDLLQGAADTPVRRAPCMRFDPLRSPWPRTPPPPASFPAGCAQVLCLVAVPCVSVLRCSRVPMVPGPHHGPSGRPARGPAATAMSDRSCLRGGAPPAQVTLALRPAGSKPGAATREVTLSRKAVTVNPVSYQTCGSVASAALPSGEAGAAGQGRGMAPRPARPCCT